MTRDISFRSTDGTFIEAVFHEAVNEKSLIIQLPCVGGNALAYRISKKELVNENISLLQFNPRGHGKSEGVLDFSKVRGDFNELYKTFLIRRKGSRLIGVGHSGGGTTLVGFQESLPIFDKIYLIAPILDTGLSLNFMYENKNIDEFIRTAGGNRKPEKLLEEILKNNQWMNREYWDENRLKEKLNADSNDSTFYRGQVGDFLENVFIPGLNVVKSIRKNKEIYRFILPGKDSWFPVPFTGNIAREFSIPLFSIKSAGDHFFKNSWGDVWKIILKDLGAG